VDHHGAVAWLEASTQADRMLAAGDVYGELRWLRIIQAIEWLQDRRGRDPFKLEH
jgi:hypothetical protein